MNTCPEVWPASKSANRPELHCEYDAHGPERYHFDGTYEVSWSHVGRKREWSGADPFKRRRVKR